MDIGMYNKKIRVIHFTIANTAGGVTSYVLNLWKYINHDRFQFDFATMSKQLDFAEKLEAEGCKIHYISTYAEEDREQFIKEVKAILSQGYDVVHLHTSWWRGFLLEEIACEMKIPRVIIHSHNTDVHIKEGQSREEARRLHEQQKSYLREDMATDYWACSQKAAEWLYGDRIPKSRIKIILNAIKLENYAFDSVKRKEYRELFGVENHYVIGHVGRFAYQKNHEFLVDVFAEVVRREPKAKLMLVGIGELQETIFEKVRSLGLANNVIFTGKRADVNCIMQAMDLFVLPSRFEGLGIVLIEAQAAGLKCLAGMDIPDEALVTDSIQRLPLEKAVWVETILKSIGYRRAIGNISELKKVGYDMGTMVKDIENMYEKQEE